jgi:dihydrofolate synthase/folylpolyglutamate synthase
MQKFSGIQPSFFEYTAVMAFQFFKDEGVDIAVIETGMGGRLDSTNVITPELSVITNISFDHKAFLGHTLAAIAAEKAGIIKPGIPVLIGETQEEALEVFTRKAQEQDAAIFFADQGVQFRWVNRSGGIFELLSRDSVPASGNEETTNVYRDSSERDGVPMRRDGVPLHCPLNGLYQEKNLVTALRALELLKDAGYDIQDHHIRRGFSEVVKLTGLRGRWETIRKRPRVICDVGHNEAGIRYITEQLTEETFHHLHWVFGMVSDKEPDDILGLLPGHASYYFCRPDIPRGLDETELKMRAERYGLRGMTYPSVKHAYRSALEAAGAHDLILVAGSTFVVAEVI